MTNKQMYQEALEALRVYYRKTTPHERYLLMIEDGIINEKGEVLMTKAEREAGHPIDEPPLNGSVPHAPTS